MVGDRFDGVPGQSAFGCVARLARLNHFSHGDLFRFLGLRLRRSDDVHQVLARSDRRQAALAAALGVPVHADWSPEHWHPFRGSWPRLGTETFRYCRACIRVGYHSHLHQLPWITSCPWHGVRLRRDCPRCGIRSRVTGDAGPRLLTCACGFDLMDERAAARWLNPAPGQEAFLSRYLRWARDSREHQVLLGAPDAPFSEDTAQALIRIPAGVAGSIRKTPSSGSDSSHERAYRVLPGGRAIALPTDAARLDELGADCPQMLELPEFLTDGIRAAARELAGKLPRGSLTAREQLLFLGSPEADLSEFVQADRPTSGTVRCLPPMTVGPRRFLDLSCIHPIVLRTLRSLEPAADLPPALGEIEVRRRLQRDLLCRGYAEGLRAVLSRYAPALHSLGRDRPHLTAGWVLLRTSAPFEARVAFTRVDVRSDAADSLSNARRAG